MMREAEESSLYFTPAGTPLREVPGPGHHDLTSPGPGAGGGARRKSHRRMVSNLSNLLPFWWGQTMGPDLEAAPNTTVAIIESDKGRARQDDGDMVAVGEEAVTLVIHAESAEVTTSESSVPSSEQSSSQQSGPAPV